MKVVEGTYFDYNIIICPSALSHNGHPAWVEKLHAKVETGVDHPHIDFSSINYYLEYYIDLLPSGSLRLNMDIITTSTHELGHQLGLADMYASQSSCGITHTYALMGRSVSKMYIPYQDLAGVIVTRGIHTDNDHIWRKYATSSGYKVKCVLCSGISAVSLATYNNAYNKTTCNNVHTLASGNLLEVAYNDTKHYYKCKHCDSVGANGSFVATEHNLTTINDSSGHRTSCNICNYSVLELHDYLFNPTSFLFRGHYLSCECGQRKLFAHEYEYPMPGYSVCRICLFQGF